MNGLVETVTKGSASFRKLNAHLIAWPSTPPRNVHAPTIGQEPAKKRIRQKSGDGMNKTERAFFEWLKRDGCYKRTTLPPQSITLRLANGCRFTPDFVTVEEDDYLGLRAYEVKGFMRDDAAVKLKVAASLYPFIRFHLVTKRKGGGWDIEEVLP